MRILAVLIALGLLVTMPNIASANGSPPTQRLLTVTSQMSEVAATPTNCVHNGSGGAIKSLPEWTGNDSLATIGVPAIANAVQLAQFGTNQRIETALTVYSYGFDNKQQLKCEPLRRNFRDACGTIGVAMNQADGTNYEVLISTDSLMSQGRMNSANDKGTSGRRSPSITVHIAKQGSKVVSRQYSGAGQRGNLLGTDFIT